MDKVWIGVLLFSLLIEIVTVQLISIWFCIGAAVALIAGWCGVQSSVQIILFVAVSGLCLAFIYPPIAKSIKGRTQNLNANRIIGESGVVSEDIAVNNGTGQIKVLGEAWSAKPEDPEIKYIKVGTPVEVVSIEGVKAVIKIAEKE